MLDRDIKKSTCNPEQYFLSAFTLSINHHHKVQASESRMDLLNHGSAPVRTVAMGSPLSLYSNISPTTMSLVCFPYLVLLLHGLSFFIYKNRVKDKWIELGIGHTESAVKIIFDIIS